MEKVKREITPHKGGRDKQINVRVSAVVYDWLKQQPNYSEYLNALVMKDMTPPKGWEHQGVLGWVEKES